MIPKIIHKTLVSPVLKIINDGRSIGIILFCCTVFSLLLANLPWIPGYGNFPAKEFHLPPAIHLPHTILHWINDGLMSLFFFLVGMEIKRELLKGELSALRRAILPVGAAMGGMLFPAAFFILINSSGPTRNGWGIPMATDIAFSLGIASLLGKRVPTSLKIFLTALAIIDDLGAILVIAIFYGSQLKLVYLLTGLGILGVNYFLAKSRRGFGWMNIALGILLWYCVYNSGIHATISGVLFAMMVPLDKLESLEHALHKPVNFIILPIFALANTAILLPADLVSAINTRLSWGILLGLLLGKPLGIILSSLLLVKLNWGELPSGCSWLQILGIGLLAGIGFTMSIFIAMLAFENPQFQDKAKISVLLASLLSMIFGYVWLLAFSKKLTQPV